MVIKFYGCAEEIVRGKKLTQKAIQKAPPKVFFEKGYRNATIAEITKLAGIAEGSIYLYYPGIPIGRHDFRQILNLSLFFRQDLTPTKNGAWLDVKKGGSFFRMDATAGCLLNSLSRNRLTACRLQPRGCLKAQYSDRSPS
jgi:hypothetical protein